MLVSEQLMIWHKQLPTVSDHSFPVVSSRLLTMFSGNVAIFSLLTILSFFIYNTVCLAVFVLPVGHI